MRISADLTGQRALETPKALPAQVSPCSCNCQHRLCFQRPKDGPPLQFPMYPLYESSVGLLTLSSASNAAGVPPHGDSLLVLQDISEVGKGAVKLPAVDSLSSLAGVLEGYAEVAAAGASRLCAVNGGGTVANLQ